MVTRGGGIIPFTINFIPERFTCTSQNCYLWIDNGVPKVHYEFSGSFPAAVSVDVGIANGQVPVNMQNINEKNVLPENLYGYTTSSLPVKTTLRTAISRTKNSTLNVNADIPLQWT